MIGMRIRANREQLALSQAQLGKRVGEMLGKEWPRQAVSAAERGARAFTAAELVAFAFSLQTSVGGLMTPHSDIADVKLGDGVVLPRDIVVAAVLPRLAGLQTHEALIGLEEASTRLGEDLLRTGDDWRALNDQIRQAAEVISLRGQAAAEGTAGRESRKPSTRQPVVIVIVTSREGVLITERRDGDPPWGFVSGEVKKDPAESPQDAAVRECKEETGLRVRAGKVIGEQNPHPRTGRHAIYIAAKPIGSTKYVLSDEDELTDLRWVSLAEADELTEGKIYGPVHDYLAAELGGK